MLKVYLWNNGIVVILLYRGYDNTRTAVKLRDPASWILNADYTWRIEDQAVRPVHRDRPASGSTPWRTSRRRAAPSGTIPHGPEQNIFNSKVRSPIYPFRYYFGQIDRLFILLSGTGSSVWFQFIHMSGHGTKQSVRMSVCNFSLNYSESQITPNNTLTMPFSDRSTACSSSSSLMGDTGSSMLSCDIAASAALAASLKMF